MAALGSLVVKLALDYAQFTGGLDKSEQAALAAGKRIQDTVSALEHRVAEVVGTIAGGLAAAFTINAFKGLISGVVESSAALHDLSIQSGASVEALSGLASVGKYSDQSAESIAGAMNKLAKNMAGATEESKGTGKALDALGIDFDKFKKLSPDEQMMTVAKAMDTFQDGSGKAAVAMALFGKEGAKMLPFFQDLASVGELQAKVTKEQADAADNFDDNLTRLHASGDAWKKQLALGMIPSMDQALTAFLEVTAGTGGLREQIKKLVDDGSIAAWTTGAIRGFSYLIDVGQGLIGVLRIIASTLRGVIDVNVEAYSAIGEAAMQAKAGDFAGAWETIKQGAKAVKSVVVDTGKDIADIWNEKLLGERFREKLDQNAAAGSPPQAAKEQLDFTNNSGGKKGKVDESDINAELARLTGSMAEVRRALKASMDGIKADYDLGIINTQEYLDRQFELQQNALAKQLKIAEQQEEVARGKKNIAAVERYQAEITRLQDEMNAGWTKHAADVEINADKISRAIAAYKLVLSDAYNTRGQAIDDSLASAGLGPVAIEQLQRMTALRREVDKKREDLVRSRDKGEAKGGISQAQFADELQALDGYWAARIQQEEGFNARSQQLRIDWSQGASKAVNTYLEQAQDVAAQTNDLFTHAISGMEDSLVRFVTTGKLSFSGLANSIIADLARMEVKALMSRLMGGSSLGGSLFSMLGIGSGSASSAGLGSATAADVAAAGDGLMFLSDGGYTGPGGKYQPAAVAHKGEIVWSQDDIARSGGVAVVEAMRLGRRGYAGGGVVDGGAIPLAASGGTSNGAALVVNLTVEQRGGPQRKVETQQQSSADGKSIDLRVVLSEVEGYLADQYDARSGPLYHAMNA